MKKSNYDLVLWVIENYEDEIILNDFKQKFEPGKNISKVEWSKFNEKYMGDMGEWYYVRQHWAFIESGGDESVYED